MSLKMRLTPRERGQHLLPPALRTLAGALFLLAALDMAYAEVQITTDPRPQVGPDISGNLIVWVDIRNGPQDIYLYDLTTNTEWPITIDGAYQDSPRISGNRIVWQDDRNGGNTNWDLYTCLYNPANGTCPEWRITTNTFGQYTPAISGNRIVWTDNRNGNLDIYTCLYTPGPPPSCPAWRVTTNPADQEEPDISGDRIVWMDLRDNVPDIYTCLYTPGPPPSCPEQLITTHPSSGPWHARISGDRIVWGDSRNNGAADTYLYDLATNAEWRITTEPTWEWSQDISGNRIVWGDSRNGNEDVYTCLYDPVTGMCPNQQVTTNPATQGASSVSGNRIVWQDDRAGVINFYVAWDIYLETLGFIDCGLRIFDGTAVRTIACEPPGAVSSQVRIGKGGLVYGIGLVDLSDPQATKIRVQTPAGLKALRQF